MFGSSTQYKFWTLKDEPRVALLRTKANQEFIDKFGENIPKEAQSKHFLTVEEERQLVKFYETALSSFCKKFRDPRDDRIKMPIHVASTAQHYFKRFYLCNSVMDYHPKEILITCAYLACKIEEFYVTISDFVDNVNGDKARASQIILNNELQLTQELQFHLIVHQPFRPVEGLLIDLKTRFPQLQDPERFRPHIEDFLDKVHLTDAIILYSPAQIALAAVTTAVSKLGTNLDHYVVDILFKDKPDQLTVLVEAVRKIKRMVKNYEFTLADPKRVEIEMKLEQCRNPENNPGSSQYKASYSEFDDDDDLCVPEPMDTSDMEVMGIEKIKSPSTY